jgi:transposase-like protein
VYQQQYFRQKFLFQKHLPEKHIHNGKQRYACCECNRQFVEYPQNKPISDETKALIDMFFHLLDIILLVRKLAKLHILKD